MRKENLFNWLFTLLFLVVGVNFASCSDDDDNIVDDNDSPEQPGTDAEEPNPAGDDFYMYVNQEWFDNLENTGETQGYDIDVATSLGIKMQYCTIEMDEVIKVSSSMTKMSNGGQEENEARVEEVIEEYLADIETKEDAYRVIGECVKKGLMSEYIKLYMVFEEGLVTYTIGPKVFMDEEGAEIHSINKINWKRYKKYTPKTRSTENILQHIVEGIDIDPEYFTYDETFDEYLNVLAACTVDELKQYIQNAIELELMPYCNDEYAKQCTEGKINTARDYFFIEFEDLFAYSLSYMFNKKYVTEENKAHFKKYGEELRSVFAKRLERNTWISNSTKQAALEKLEKMNFYFGGPAEWAEEGFPKPQGNLFIDDIMELKASRGRAIEAKMGKSFKDESMTIIILGPNGSPLTESNAIYSTFNNAMNIFPSFMMEPEYSAEMNPAHLYALLYVLGHEMTHGFDIEGAEYDAEGEENNWWTDEDKEKFQILNQQLSEQISTFEVAPGIKANGPLTVSEILADLGGLNIAFDALTEYMKKKGIEGEELAKAQKEFFEYHAYRYCIHYSESDLQEILNDEHGVNMVRVNGIIQHMNPWYELYNVVEGNKLYLPAERRLNIW